MVVHGEAKFTFPGGEIKQEVTSITLVNNTTLTANFSVPSNKKWVLLGYKVTNPDDVDRGVTIEVWKEAAATNRLSRIDTATVVASGFLQFPYQGATSSRRQSGIVPAFLLVAGNTIRFVWGAGGASAGGVDADGVVLEYLEIGS